MAIDDKAVAASVRRTAVELRLRRRAILRALQSSKWETVRSLPDLANSEFDQAIRALKDREEQLLKSADPEKRKELQSELQELEDRVWLSTILEDAEHEIWRLGHLYKPTHTKSAGLLP